MSKLRLTRAAFAGMLVLSGCGVQVQGTTSEEKAETPPPPARAAVATVAIPVEALYPERANVAAFFETTSRIKAERRVDVVAEGVGLCEQVLVEEGDRVRAGQVLAELDTTELEAQIQQTEVNVRQQENALRIAERSLEEGIGASVERDNARFSHEQALATLKTQQVQLEKMTVRAPIPGIIARRHIQQGMLVSGGSPAFTIVDPESFVLPISVPERELPKLSSGQEARVTIDARPGEPLTARVGRISPIVDQGGTVEIQLEFAPEVRSQLRESAFARVRLVMRTQENALVLPKDTILEDSTRKYVMVVREQHPAGGDTEGTGGKRWVAERVEVQTGLEDSDKVEILSGLGEDSLVVSLGQHTLREGAEVEVTNARDLIAAGAETSAESALQAAREEAQRIRDTRGGRGR